MKQSYVQSSAWYHAITLTERMASRSAIKYKMSDVEVNAELAGQRLQRWRSQPPFATGCRFALRLEMDGMTEEDLHSLLGEPIEAVHSRFSVPPAWLVELAQAFSRPTAADSLPFPESLHGQAAVGFLDLIEPLISQGRARVYEGIRALIQTRFDLPFDPGTIDEIMVANLPGRLLEMLSYTMVQELHKACLQGLLKDDTPEARFQSFVQRLRQRDTALALLQDYPVLARQLISRIDQWVRFSLEFLQHLCADWDVIHTTFSPEGDPGVLVQVSSGMGASYQSGRSVLIARFGSGFQAIYKPRSMAVDGHFQELLTWLNERGDHPPFRTLTILDRGHYGWVEFVAAQGCTSEAEVQRFYERQGGYLALLYVLEGIDFSAQNLIAAGEHPVLIDLESLFHARMKGIDRHRPALPVSNAIVYSVMRVGLLPQRLGANAGSGWVDLSGLSGEAGQFTQDVPYREGTGADAMWLTRMRVAMPGGQNRPTLNGIEVDVLNYAQAITTGFTSVYRALLEHRDDLLADYGPLARFAGDEVRAFFRPTPTYGALLQESFHPDVLRDALDRDRLFDWLWSGVAYCPDLARVIPAEREDLWQGNIPKFTTHPGSRDLWSSTNECIGGFFSEPSLALVKRRMQQLSDHDLTQQLWFIRASLATLTNGLDRARRPSYRLTEPQTIATHEQLLATARAVGDRLGALALRNAGNISWIGLKHTHECHWSITLLGMDLYDGLPGVALFLAYLGAITREERYAALAHVTLTTLRRQVERCRSFIMSIGSFTGWGGLIYTLTHLGILWNESALLTEAEAIVEHLPTLIERDDLLDITAGAAGCIGGLLSLYRCVSSDRTLAAAIQCGERLITCAQSMEDGLEWVIAAAGPKPLTGFSHGAAGIAWALLELAALTGEERFRTAACAAIAYERRLFSPETGNWPDLRELKTSRQTGDNGQQRFMTAWCHGAPGIGLARLCSLRHLDDAAIRVEIDTALQTTLAQGFGGNHSLCHGDLGNLELLLQASQVLAEPQWRAQVDRIAAIILESISRDGRLCGTPLGVESPGLMTGLAGIGYGLLRLAEPTRVPSVLVLEPPVRHK
jgi:type 2 lantibiotic biosynthesis protein LanM